MTGHPGRPSHNRAARNTILAALAVGVVAAFMTAVFLTPQPPGGTVIAKRVRPAHSWTGLQPVYGQVCSGTGVPALCRFGTAEYRPVVMHDPECPELRLADRDRAERTLCVPRPVYDAHPVGSWYREPTP